MADTDLVMALLTVLHSHKLVLVQTQTLVNGRELGGGMAQPYRAFMCVYEYMGELI